MTNPPNGKISSNLTDLDELNKEHQWIPGQNNIRPTEQEKARKLRNCIVIDAIWSSSTDFVLHTHFKQPFKINANGQRYVAVSTETLESVFIPNDFPYQLPEYAKHFVLWYGPSIKSVDDAQVTNDIRGALDKINPDTSFAWYENPKMTITEMFHVQVFWVENSHLKK